MKSKSRPGITPEKITIGELAFSIAIVSLGALALSFSILEFKSTELASQTTVGVVSIEESLAGELVNVKNYQDEATKIALRSGRSPSNLVFHVQLPTGSVDVHVNETVTLNREFQKCSSYPIGECGYKIRLNFEPHPPAFSYEVSSAFAEAALNLARSDRNEVIIPRSAYRDPNHVACDLRKDIGLSGLLSSDRYDCIGRPQKSCPRGTLPKGLAVDPQTHTLELDCGAPSKIARCPAYYALNRVNTKTLDAAEIKSAQCVRTTETIAYPAKQPDPGFRLVGKACPQGYRSQSTCSLVNVKSKPGKCGVGVAKPVAGRLHFTENKPVGTVDCGVDLRAQTCGAEWIGLAQLKVKCVLDQPEFAHAL